MNDINRNALATTQGFSESSSNFAVQETASTMAAAQGKAMVEARYVMALRNPRNWDQVRLDILTECRRPSYANNKSVYYVKPIGQGVEGLGIRFVESALRHMGNVLIEPTLVFEDDSKEIFRVSVTDLEANITHFFDAKVPKTVERSKPLDDGTYISMRLNSWKKPVYTVPANDDDLLNKRGAAISKVVRSLGLRIIPGDIQDEAIEIIKAIRLDDAARDPAAERKKIVDAFSALGVKAVDLVTYLGHDLDQCSPAELVNLRGIYGAIRDGEATWTSVIENRAEQAGASKPVEPPKMPESKSAKKAKPEAAVPQAESQSGPAAGARDIPDSAGMATDGEKNLVKTKLDALGISIDDALNECGLSNFETLTADGFLVMREFIASREK